MTPGALTSDSEWTPRREQGSGRKLSSTYPGLPPHQVAMQWERVKVCA
jgi:hypothetical protein